MSNHLLGMHAQRSEWSCTMVCCFALNTERGNLRARFCFADAELVCLFTNFSLLGSPQ